MADRHLALVTGGNRGIGLEVCRQLKEKGLDVILTARSEEKGKEAAKRRGAYFHQLDVTSDTSVKACASYVKEEFGRLDVLVNNAGICLDWDVPMIEADPKTARETFETNVLGPLRLSQVLAPLLRRAKPGRIINVSSGAGQLSQRFSALATYRLSKAALNMVTVGLAGDLYPDVLVNCVSPGWCKTDMGGPGAPKSAAKGADTIIWLATACKQTGKFWADRKEIEW